MASSSSSRTLIDLFQPAKRLKRLPSPPSPSSTPNLISTTAAGSSSKSSPLRVSSSLTNDFSGAGGDDASISLSSPSLTGEEQAKIEFNKLQANSRRNLKICLDRVATISKEGDSKGLIDLEKLLVEETWLGMNILDGEFHKPYAKELYRYLQNELYGSKGKGGGSGKPIYPPLHLIFNALNTTPFHRVKAVIIGQDPYHGPGQAMGLSFSVPKGVKIPSSLMNMYKELKQDLGCSIPSHGNLEKWAIQGVLLLNSVLTVREHEANSHAKKGWEQFTDAVIKTISVNKQGVIFLLWGNYAQAKSRLIDETRHHILKSAHPSGLSAHRGFFGCRHFSRTNQLLEQMGESPIDWQL
ncbi:uracil-DNA glycosylase, mitochondrial [Impatiens glandulifera]|uniref:uracil-DNA glycosylase, mitochondrial n=1 Tax=Impatiens glandulifera TaxID=253017 RepID=UPI001FB0DDF8|nr:uracil-DNA glycosylase, mitochondrial [Impatiens glandulifera]